MTDKDTESDSDKSRRSFMRDGAIASGGLALGLSAAGTAAAQDDGTVTDDGDGGGVLENNAKGLIQTGNVYPAARFVFVSGAVNWTPNYGDVRDSWFSDYNTYMIRWLNTGNVVPFWVAQDADIGEFDSDLGFIADNEDQNQPQLYEMEREFTPFGDNPNLTEVEFSAVDEDVENRILQDEDWWQQGDQGVAEDGATNETAGNETDAGLLGNETETAGNGNETDDDVL